MSLMESLLKLYTVDRQVRGLRSRLESAQRYVDAQTRLLNDVNQRLEELQLRKRHLQAKVANLESEGVTLDEQLEKFRGDLNSAVTNKQYTAVLTELNTVKAARSKIDDAMLEEMDQIEQVDHEIEEVTAQKEERQKVVNIAETQLEERQTEVGERLSELETEREDAAHDVPGPELAVFDEMARAYDGEAMAPVEEIDRRRREYACGACNLHMPFEQVATLTTVVSSLVRCTACGRILFMEEETRGALVKK